MQYILNEKEFQAYQEAMKLKEDYSILVNAYKAKEQEIENFRSENTSLRGRLKDICGIAQTQPRTVLRTCRKSEMTPDLDALAALKAQMDDWD